jgi:hypothetical protein
MRRAIEQVSLIRVFGGEEIVIRATHTCAVAALGLFNGLELGALLDNRLSSFNGEARQGRPVELRL